MKVSEKVGKSRLGQKRTFQSDRLTHLTDRGIEKKVRYRTELVLCDQCRRLTTAHNIAAPDRIF